jgi:hypothetical protein
MEKVKFGFKSEKWKIKAHSGFLVFFQKEEAVDLVRGKL